MKKVFVGEDTHLGRFGLVRKGDIIDLTEREASHVADDKRFKEHKEGAALPKPAGLKLPDDFDQLDEAAQKEAIAKAELAEKERLAALALQNEKTEKENFDQMSKDQLIAYATQLRKDGKTVEFKPDATKKQIRSAVRKALGQDVPEEAGDEGDKPEE